MKPKILKQKIIFKNNWMKVRRTWLKFPKSKVVKWDDIIGHDAVVIIPIDKKNNVYLSKEWRSAFRREILHVPIGHAEGNIEKRRLKQVRNELREEVGLDTRKIEKLAEVSISLRDKTIFHIYLARNLFQHYKNPDKNEYINVVRMPFKKAYRMFMRRKIISSESNLLAFLLAKEKLKL